MAEGFPFRLPVDASLATSPVPGPGRGKQLLVWVVTLAIVAISIWQGLRLRTWTWELFSDCHFVIDITRGYGWGRAGAVGEGYLNLYEKMANQQPNWPLWLDYAPLRLGVMTLWAGYNEHAQTNPGQWRHDYPFNQPVLRFNAGMELLASVLAFLVVRRMLRSAWSGPPSRMWLFDWKQRLLRRPFETNAVAVAPPLTGWWRALAAALLMWFNPAMILNGHAYPTWDIWLIPMFLLALLAGLYERWALAGIAIGLGAMFKGQLFFGVSGFVAWTLLNGNWRGTVRFLCGIVISIGVVASPWMLTYIPADSLAKLYAEQAKARDSYDFQPFVAVRYWNWPALLSTVAVLGVSVYATMRWVRGRWNRVLIVATATAVMLLLAMPLFGASHAWWDCGIAYGTRHWRAMITGLTDNLPGILSESYRWRRVDDIFVQFNPSNTFGLVRSPIDVSVHSAMRSLMVLFLLPCLWAIARQARRRDPRLLVAITAPWIVFFFFPTQIHERYLLYAAAIGVIWIGHSVGIAMLSVFLSVATWVQVTHVLLSFGGYRGRRGFGENLHAWKPEWFDVTAGETLMRVITPTHPDLGWAIGLAVLIVIWVSVGTTRRINDAPEEIQTPPTPRVAGEHARRSAYQSGRPAKQRACSPATRERV